MNTKHDDHKQLTEAIQQVNAVVEAAQLYRNLAGESAWRRMDAGLRLDAAMSDARAWVKHAEIDGRVTTDK